jgi:H+/Cl- antiporter ClcA
MWLLYGAIGGVIGAVFVGLFHLWAEWHDDRILRRLNIEN